MATAGSVPCEEQFFCSICLNAFNEPVSTPCGHNYCKSCITEYWDSQSSPQVQCPLCKKRFKRRPELQINTEFRDMVDHFNRMRLKSEYEVAAQPGKVPCDVCTEPKRKAHKTCLVCMASFCQPHLEPHQRLKKHKLVNPVPNLEDRVCKTHDKMLELFCLTDEECVCLLCLNDNHTAHKVVPLECVFQKRKPILEIVTSEMKMMENIKIKSVKKIKRSIQQSRKRVNRDIADIVQVLTGLVASVKRRQGELIQVVEQKQKTLETQAEERIKQLEQDIADLSKRRSELEQIIQTEDHLHLVQKCPPLHLPEDSNETNPQSDPDESQHTYIEMVKQSVAQIEQTLNNQMEMLISDIRSTDDPNQSDAAEHLTIDDVTDQLSPPQDDLMKIQQSSAVNVTLDPYTANYNFKVSEGGKKLTSYRDYNFFYSLLNRVIKGFPLVLTKEGFSSNKFYYEVQVSGSTSWILGVVKESINRELSHYPSAEEGAYLLYGSYYQFVRQIKTVGVFVDYKMGEVSFYDVETRTLFYSHKECKFTEMTLQGFLYSLIGVRTKLYPVFGFQGDFTGETLVITPVRGMP